MHSYVKKTKAQSKLEYALVITIIVIALIAMLVYLKRGVGGRIKKVSDELGVQYSPEYTTANVIANKESEINETVGIEEGQPVTRLASIERENRLITEKIGGFNGEFISGEDTAGGQIGETTGIIEEDSGASTGTGGISGGGETAGTTGGTGNEGATGEGTGSGGSTGGGIGTGGGTGTGGGGGGTGEGGGGTGGGTEEDTGGGAATYNSDLLDALALLENSNTGSYYFDLIKSNNISVIYEDFSNLGVAGVLAYWLSISDNTIHVNELLRTQSPESAIAAIIVHEATHADYAYSPQKWIDYTKQNHPELSDEDIHITSYPFNSIDQEYNCFKNQILTWKELKGSNTDLNNDTWEAVYDQGEAYMKSQIRITYAEAGQDLPEY